MPFRTADHAALRLLVRECLTPGKAERRRQLPMVLLWGPRASGRSQLLDQLEGEFSTRRPFVRRSGDQLLGCRPHRVALVLAFFLGQRVEGFGRLKFPRLLLGLAVIRGRGPHAREDTAGQRGQSLRDQPEDLQAERARLRQLLRDNRELAEQARGMAIELGDAIGNGKLTRFFLGVAFEGTFWLLYTVFVLRRGALLWYRDGLGRHFADPLDALATLARYEATGEHSVVDEVLCRAFLADLRDGYSPRFPRARARDENCLALLDDADRPAVREFLDMLARQRREWDPLLIVATASTRCPSGGTGHPEQWPVRRAYAAGYTDWSKHRESNNGWETRYPLLLGAAARYSSAADGCPVCAAESTREDVDLTGVLGDARRALSFAHRLTDGHIGALDAVLRAVSLRRAEVGREPVDVRGVLGWPIDPADGTALADVFVGGFVASAAPEIRQALVSCCAAPDFGEQALARVLRGEEWPVPQRVSEFHAFDLWVRHPRPPENDLTPRLHPFVRRAGLYQLARRTERDGPTWNAVHDRLRRAATEEGDSTAALYHDLALGRAAEVAQNLSALFADLRDARAWFEVLRAVTMAPLAKPDEHPDSQAHCKALTGHAGESSIVRPRLVAAMQIHTDPLGDPDHELCQVIQRDLAALAERVPYGFFYLLEKAAEFSRCWERWHVEVGMHS